MSPIILESKLFDTLNELGPWMDLGMRVKY